MALKALFISICLSKTLTAAASTFVVQTRPSGHKPFEELEGALANAVKSASCSGGPIHSAGWDWQICRLVGVIA